MRLLFWAARIAAFCLMWALAFGVARPAAARDDMDGRAKENTVSSTIEGEPHDQYDDEDGERPWWMGHLPEGYRWTILAGAGSSLLTDKSDSSYLAETVGFALTVGYRVTTTLSVLLHAEQNMWRSQEIDGDWNSGVFDLGLGIDYEVVAPYVHASFLIGVSVLTFDTTLDDAGSTGVFLDFAPIDLRWVLFQHLVISLLPLSLRLEAPVTHEPVIHYMQYRTVLRLGAIF